MSDKFLNNSGSGNADITNGSINAYLANLTIAGLRPSTPIKTNSVNTLISTKLDITDINTLESRLDSSIYTPYTGTIKATDYETDNYFSVNDELQKIDNLEASTQGPDITNINGLTISDEFATDRLYDKTQTTWIGLDGDTVNIAANDLTSIDIKTKSLYTTDNTGMKINGNEKTETNNTFIELDGVNNHIDIAATGYIELNTPEIIPRGNIVPDLPLTRNIGSEFAQFGTVYTNKITSLAAPTTDFDAARKKYVDDITTPLTTKTQNITDSIANTSTTFIGHILPSAHNTYDLGEGGDSFRDIYLRRVLSINGTANISVGNSSITTSQTTFTADQEIVSKAYVDNYFTFTQPTGAVVVCSLRKIISSYIGSCCRIRRSSDSVEQDFGFNSMGVVDIDAVSTFIGGGTAFIRTIYDQSGNNYDYGQTETAKQPTLVWTGSIPEILFNTGNQNKHFDSVQTTSTMGLNTGIFSQMTIFKTASSLSQFYFSSSGPSQYGIYSTDPTNLRTLVNGPAKNFTVSNINNNQYHTLTLLVNSGSTNIRYDGTTNTPQSDNIVNSNRTLIWGADLNDNFDLQDYSNELIVWASIPSDGLLASIETEQNDLWVNLQTTFQEGKVHYNPAENNLQFYDGSVLNTVGTVNQIENWERPVMTGFSTPIGYTVTTNSINPTWTNYWQVFDNIISEFGNWWHSITGVFSGAGNTWSGGSTGKAGIPQHGAWVVLELPKPQIINQYTIQPRFDLSDGRIVDWYFIYSMDGTTYSVGDTVVNSPDNNTPVVRNITPIAGKYIGVQITKTRSNFALVNDIKFNGNKDVISYVDSAKDFIDLTPTTEPAAVEGRIYYDDVENVIKFYNGGKWQGLTPSWISPVMTDYTSPTPYIVSASTELALGNRQAWLAFDHLTGSSWLSAVGRFSGGSYVGSASTTGIPDDGEWIKIQLDRERPINELNFQPFVQHNPKSFHIMYSTDGATYTSILNIVNAPPTGGVFNRYTFTSTIAKWWGIQFYEVVSDTYVGAVEIRFKESYIN